MPVTVCMRTNRSSPGVYNTLSSISSAEILQDKIETQEGYSGPAQEDVRILRAVKIIIKGGKEEPIRTHWLVCVHMHISGKVPTSAAQSSRSHRDSGLSCWQRPEAGVESP
jgi:hypothetical protein